jgi:hypothetical protein
MRQMMRETPTRWRRISNSRVFGLAIIVAGIIGLSFYVSPDHPLRFLTEVILLDGTLCFVLLVPITVVLRLERYYPRLRQSYGLRLLVGGPFFAVPWGIYRLTVLLIPGLGYDQGPGPMYVLVTARSAAFAVIVGALILAGHAVWRVVRRHANMDRNESHAGN